ncbi:hypothetical protein BN946_scf184579.g24 [Trametes cinnabarina]|uniref:Uncharacterized protein n=1 Tax=Pycnoporus cinnabarinus TaxID=5643 RepID=A0A060SDU1_PYCCI|nr:hypothetical protein BN946_scf184579.g24 [Trametes cinnabarina]
MHDSAEPELTTGSPTIAVSEDSESGSTSESASRPATPSGWSDAPTFSEDQENLIWHDRVQGEGDDDDVEYLVQEMINEQRSREAETIHNYEQSRLRPEDWDSISAFRLRFIANVSRAAYDKFREAFGDRIQLDSDWVLLHRIAELSRIQPIWYDCCINSCLAYLGDLTDAETCPECQEPRRTPTGRTRRFFCYIPFIPRLQALFQSPDLIYMMQYRARFDNMDDDIIRDVFSSDHYRRLRTTRVLVDGQELPHLHFSDARDIAFAICMDAYLLFQRKRAGPSATPILLQNYNLPPDLRIHLDHLFCLGIIGGPNQPKRLHTFLIPFEEECVQLAHGVSTYDALKRELFLLHAYCILCLGDIIAILKALNMRGVNAVVPCRTCLIRGLLIPGKTNYYVPLRHPLPVDPDELPVAWDPWNLPLRTHSGILKALEEMRSAQSFAYRDKLGRHYGLRCRRGDPFLGPVIGTRVQSTLDYACSCPWDWMHLFCENNIPNLVSLWMGRFKTLDDEGAGAYVIPDAVWAQIAQETSAAVQDIPSAFVSAIPDLINARDSFTAEIWAFWFIYIAPIVLRGRFADSKYYDHMCDLAAIMKTTLRFEITRAEVQDLRAQIIHWVESYEEYYYQYDAGR